MPLELYTVLEWFTILSVYPVIILFLYNFKALNQPLKFLFILTIISALFDFISILTVKLGGYTHYVFHLYSVLEAVLIFIFYYQIFRLPLLRLFVIVAAFILAIVLIISFSEPYALSKMNDLVSFCQSFIVTIFSILFFYQTLKLLDIPVLKKSYLFWMNTGILIYSSLPALVFLSYRLIEGDNFKTKVSWAIFMIASLLFHLFLFIGLCNYKNKETL